MAVAAALAAETCKQLSNGPKCLEVGVDLHFCRCGGSWGKEVQEMISRLSSHLAISMFSPEPTGLADFMASKPALG